MYLTAQQPSPGRVGKCAINIGHSIIAGMSSLQITFWREDGEVVSSGSFLEINLSLCAPLPRNLGGKTVLRHVFSKERELYRFLVLSSECVLIPKSLPSRAPFKSLRGRDDPSRLDMGIGRNWATRRPGTCPRDRRSNASETRHSLRGSAGGARDTHVGGELSEKAEGKGRRQTLRSRWKRILVIIILVILINNNN